MREKLINDYEKKMGNAKVIKDQHLEYKMNVIKRIQEEQLEGELIRRQVDDEINKEHERELQRKRKQADMRENLKKANEEITNIKIQEMEKELESEKRIA